MGYSLGETNQGSLLLSLVLQPNVSSLHTRSIASLAHSASPCFTAIASCTGTYYFSKTVPRDLKPHYTRNRIIICLKTKSAKKAELSSKSLLSKLENYWLGLRLTHTAVR